MFGREKRPEPDQIDVILGPRASFHGHLRCDGSIRLDGVVEGGHIETPANVIVTAAAKVIADITARNVSVSGAVKGTITAERVELLSGGRIWGTVNTASFLLDEGGFLRGELVMRGEAPEEPFVIPPPEAPIPVQTAEEATIPPAGE
ncbi:MAG: polymer-forming cytoskeletal protein [Anaerolineae bacterium]|nr:polymer-forming cytoskeletal protein [Anaerolineae bacterium]